MSEILRGMHERAKRQEARILFPESGDERVLAAALQLKEDGLGEPIMVHATHADVSAMTDAGLTRVGVDEIRAAELEKLLLELRGKKGLSPEEARTLARDPLIYAMYLLRIGEADALVAGAVHPTADVVRAGLWLTEKAPGIESISSSFYMLVPPFRGGEKEEVLTFADCGVIPEPTSGQLADIAIAAADARRFVVGDQPVVAFLSYSTKGSGGDGTSPSRVREAISMVKARRPDIILIDDESQGDAVLKAAVGLRKGLPEEIAGKANVLVFPSLDAGNIAYKLVETLVPGAKAIGPILHGFSKPINDLSRGASVEDIKHSATIAALQVKK